MSRSSRRGPWLPEEDSALIELVRTQGPNNWVRISQQLQHRSPKQCRERYHQNLKPSLNHEPISAQEGEMIEQLVDEMGKRWAEIARRLGNRSDNAVKNWWNGSMNRRGRHRPLPKNFDQMRNRLHPISTSKSPKSHHDLPAGLTSNHRQFRPEHLRMSNRWSAPGMLALDQQGQRQGVARLESRSESDLLLPEFAHQTSSDVCRAAPSTERRFRHSDTFYSSTESSRLPPLRLPPMGTLSTATNYSLERPALSPANSDASQSLSSLPAPSLVSDTQSIYSTSPKTATSPRLTALPHLSTDSSFWHHLDRPTSYEYHGLPGQMTLSPLQPSTMAMANLSQQQQGCQPLYPPVDYGRVMHYNPFGNTPPPRNDTIKDSRMQVSRLVQ